MSDGFELGPPASSCPHRPHPALLGELGAWKCPECGVTFVLREHPVKNILKPATQEES